MISENYAKQYCSEDLNMIENYELAINDTTQIWDCHHRGEILPCGRFSVEDLDKFGLYFKIPASELIFLTPAEHTRLHHKGVPLSEATKQAMSDARKGVSFSEAHKQAISEGLKGVLKSEEHKQKLSKKILQYTKSGEFIREWQSMTAIWQELGIRKGNICACCKGNRQSAGGYVWKYS